MPGSENHPSETRTSETRTAAVIGLGVIGGSIAAALTARGWAVIGDDANPETVAAAIEQGLIERQGLEGAEITFIATPAGAVVEQVRRALASTEGLVTDVASVKGEISAAISDERFVAGHPMAGSELPGLEGASGDMFDGAVWVLCPSVSTVDSTLSSVRAVLASMGADVVVIDAHRHDELVAMISHVPHLTAATLMSLATERAIEHRALLRLAAGGFRDMTRIASGAPDMWIDVCAANRIAIVGVLDDLIGSLTELRDDVDQGQSDKILGRLTEARSARTNLPSSALHPSELSEIWVPITDRPGELQQVLSLAGELNVNVYDIEISHVAERDEGLLVVVVSSAAAPLLDGGLMALGFRPRIKKLS